jgi:aryl-alcohol dehydrogenase-like predicted oxidoreductase
MENRRLGEAGPTLSLVGLGCNNFGLKLDERETREVVHAALDAGITHFDTAETYGRGHSEVFLGKALGARRSAVTLATKFASRPKDERYRPGFLRRRIYEGCETSLRRLGTDHIDLYYQHHPDPEAPIEEALEAMTELVSAGKVVYAACSNFDANQVDEAAVVSSERGLVSFVACQIHWNLLARQAEARTVPAIRRHGMGIVPYFPLESGLLTGKYRKGSGLPRGSRLAELPRYTALANERNFALVARLGDYAKGQGHSLLELAFGWLAAQEGVASVIAGATSADQVQENVEAGRAWKLSATEIEDVARLT